MRFLVFFCLVGACLAANTQKQPMKNRSKVRQPHDNSAAANTYKTGFSSYPDLPNHSHQFPTTNQGCFPYIIAEPVAADPMTRLGRYYEYRMAYKDGQAYNAQYTVKMVNADYVPGTKTPMVHTVQDDYRWITLGSNGSSSTNGGNSKDQVTCNYNFNDIQSRYDGVDIYQLFDPENGPVSPIVAVEYLLYVEPGERGWEVQYQCDKPNESTKKCDQVNLWVNTRVHPNDMSKDEQQKMDDTINSVLQPYCMTTEDLQKVIFRDDLSIDQCNQSPPEAFTNLVIGTDVGLRDRPADAST